MNPRASFRMSKADGSGMVVLEKSRQIPFPVRLRPHQQSDELPVGTESLRRILW